MLIEGPQREEKTTMKRAGAEDILIKGPQRKESRDNNESGRR